MDELADATTGRAHSSPKRSCVINARFSQPEAAAIMAAAEQAGMTMSTFIRSLSLEGAGVEPFLNADDRAIFGFLQEELRRIGVNLNSLLRSVHRGILREPEIAAQLAELKPALAALGLEIGKLAPRAAGKQQRAG